MAEGDSVDIVMPFVENEDYYLDHGLMVLTARYHLRRGYCCDQDCRHCPYREPAKQKARVDDHENQTSE